MKLEMDLSSIFAEGPEDQPGMSVQELIRDAVITQVTSDVRGKVKDILDQKLNEVLGSAVNAAVQEFLDKQLPVLMDHEFTETTTWGEKKGTYTVRNRILKALDDQANYKKESYSSDRNSFTKCLDDIVQQKMSDFKKQINTQVDAKFTKEAMEYAEEKLRERLKVSSK